MNSRTKTNMSFLGSIGDVLIKGIDSDVFDPWGTLWGLATGSASKDFAKVKHFFVQLVTFVASGFLLFVIFSFVIF